MSARREPTSKPLPEVDRSLIHRPEQPCVLHGTLFFKDFQRVLGHAAMAASSLCRARRTGFWGVQPHWRISVPTCCRQCFTPNSRSKTAATRRRFHTSPRNPYASAPFCQKSRNLLLLLFAQLRFSPWVLPRCQGLFALFAATFEPLAHGPFRHTECFGDISLLPALVLQVPSS